MRIESGSQNASRIPGMHVYPAPRYNQSPVEEVSKIRGGWSDIPREWNLEYRDKAIQIENRDFREKPRENVKFTPYHDQTNRFMKNLFQNDQPIGSVLNIVV